jgi:isochorismate pyruvate lyase
VKKPLECKNMDDIRFEIDNIDSKIVALMGQRAEYVHTAAKFKRDKVSVKAPERVRQMLAQRRQWAEEQNIDPNFIESLFSTITEYFISKEMKTWNKHKSAQSISQ